MTDWPSTKTRQRPTYASPFTLLPESDRMSERHPITGTTDRYSLDYMLNPKINLKDPEEQLRSLNICSTLRAEINSLVAEQFNRELELSLASVHYYRVIIKNNKVHREIEC